jgi:hypothetical protein
MGGIGTWMGEAEMNERKGSMYEDFERNGFTYFD